jgi:hypothetical protein
MTGADLVVRPSQPLSKAEDDALREQVRMIQQTAFVPVSYRGKPHEIYACVLTGRSLGLDPMTALRQIYIVDGKASLSAELMVALARRAGHSITGESSSQKATVIGKRGDNDDTLTVTYTLEDAKRAGIAGKQNWQKHPADMCWARAVSQLCRRLFPDVLAGVSYTPDEAELTPDERNAVSTEDLPLPPDPEDSSATPPPEPADDGGPSPAAAAAPDVVEQDDGCLRMCGARGSVARSASTSRCPSRS